MFYGINDQKEAKEPGWAVAFPKLAPVDPWDGPECQLLAEIGCPKSPGKNQSYLCPAKTKHLVCDLDLFVLKSNSKFHQSLVAELTYSK